MYSILDNPLNCHTLSESWEANTNQVFNTDKLSEMKKQWAFIQVIWRARREEDMVLG